MKYLTRHRPVTILLCLTLGLLLTACGGQSEPSPAEGSSSLAGALVGGKRSMKTVHQKVEANEYVAPGGLQLSKQYDRYTHTTEVRSKISSSDDSSSSGTSSCSGGGGSGRSGKF